MIFFPVESIAPSSRFSLPLSQVQQDLSEQSLKATLARLMVDRQ
jgi:hypothetical protein